jgi:hypothetical protein
VRPTLRGVGLTDARQKIQLDRYSRLSDQGASIAFLDSSNSFRGWKTVFTTPASWVQYNGVSFGKQKLKTIIVRVAAAKGGRVQIRLDNAKGPVIGQLTIPPGSEWQELRTPLLTFEPGTHNLVVSSRNDAHVAIDWIKFE